MYKKYTYWLKKEEFIAFQKIMRTQEIPVYEAKKAVCLPLSSKIALGYVSPEAWSHFDLCRRQLSWYGISRFANQYLVISDKELGEYGFDMTWSTRISKIKFKPKKLPLKDTQAINSLATKDLFVSSCPSAFYELGAEEGLERWLKIMGIRGYSYKELFVHHQANHANFMEPEFFMENGDGRVPYSIGKTNQVCSACLEFFNIIGEEFKTKYVVPCPGAVLFAGMAVNKYYQIETPL